MFSNFFSTAIGLLGLITAIQANLYPTSPVGGTTCTGGSPCSVKWQDDGQAPTLSTFTQGISVDLYTGSTFQQTLLATLIQGVVPSKMVASVVVPPSVGPNGMWYFMRLTGTDAAGQNTTVYTAKFTMQGMSGTFSPAVVAEISAGSSSIASTLIASSSAVALASSASSVVISSSAMDSLSRSASSISKMSSMAPSTISAMTVTPTSASLVASASSTSTRSGSVALGASGAAIALAYVFATLCVVLA